MYKNQRPSKFSNFGEDVKGARRHNFDTYDVERVSEVKKNTVSKEDKATLKRLKKLIQEDFTSENILNYENFNFKVKTGLSVQEDMISLYKEEVSKLLTRKERNGLRLKINAILKIRHQVKYLSNTWTRQKLEKKYLKQNNPLTTGEKILWKNQKRSAASEDLQWVKENLNALQFGNSVSDAEREYIVVELKKELTSFMSISDLDLKKISFSFGARGKRGSVAYYQPDLNIISVNRNTIGSLMHELAHAMDYDKGLISSKISFETVRSYRKQYIKDKFFWSKSAYFCNKKEIFARAFEAYCLELGIFGSFSQSSSKNYLPELNDELRALIKEALQRTALAA